MSPTSRELLLAYRWPAAVVVSSVLIAATAIQLLSKPIPIRVEGGLQVDKLVLPRQCDDSIECTAAGCGA